MTTRRPLVVLDRDGTLIEEPPDQQVDSLDKVRFMPGVFAALARLRARGYDLVMVTNQDGLGTTRYPRVSFDRVQDFLLKTFASQGIAFEGVFVCPHDASAHCSCRKPAIGLVEPYLSAHPCDPESSAVVGDRPTDLEFARRLGLRGFLVQRHGSPDETWPTIVTQILARRAHVHRETGETVVDVRVDLEATAPLEIDTGLGFFDHMLAQLARHGGFSLRLEARGDLDVDEHHTVEDCALALGQALQQALGTKAGIARYGFLLPMDEALARVVIDLSGRPYCRFMGRFYRERVGDLPTELVPHFFQSLATSLGATLHLAVRGENHHHMIEACFKGVGRALRQAIRPVDDTIPSTKGTVATWTS